MATAAATTPSSPPTNNFDILNSAEIFDILVDKKGEKRFDGIFVNNLFRSLIQQKFVDEILGKTVARKKADLLNQRGVWGKIAEDGLIFLRSEVKAQNARMILEGG